MGEGSDDRREFRVGREGHNEDFGGRNTGREREDTAFSGVGTCPVDVFDEGIQDAADPEGGLDNVGSVFPYYKSYISYQSHFGLSKRVGWIVTVLCL